MNAVAAFENRKDTLRAQLEESENMPQAISAATMTLEQIACDLAQDEQDDFARQRQQAVMALAKRLPLGLRASRPEPAVTVRQPEPVSDTERRVLACIGPKPVGMEELRVSTGLPTAVLLSTLMKLVLAKRVEQQPGQRYVLR